MLNDGLQEHDIPDGAHTSHLRCNTLEHWIWDKGSEHGVWSNEILGLWLMYAQMLTLYY